MSRPVFFLPEVSREVEMAFHWYERQRVGLGHEFLLAFDALIERVRRLPEGHKVVALRTRKALLRRFPYPVLYVVGSDHLLITAVFDGRRDPRQWSDRAREEALRERAALL